ncbi:MAG: PIN domain-containing protein [Candidatus Uhrbacteria bacterium]|nr:PIN domain-containing protein [Candidatus Uhrbacteria bacterium]
MTVFDSNVWIAAFHESDTLHHKAISAIKEHQPPFGVPEYVLLEVATILAKKGGMEHARTFIDMIFDNRDCAVLFSNESFCRSVARAYGKEAKAELSFVDMSLVVLGAQHKVVTFDAHLARRLRKV